MQRKEGIRQIEEAEWVRDEVGCLNLIVTDDTGRRVHAWLRKRPLYCDRGHIQLHIEAPGLYIDSADSFPRYFFSFEEADQHTRAFLKWRLWKERTNSLTELESRWERIPLVEGVWSR